MDLSTHRPAPDHAARRYTDPTPAGHRVMFLGHEGAPRAKWRVRPGGWKIYGRALEAVGKVSVSKDGGLVLMPLTGEPAKTRWDAERREVVFPSLRVRQHATGWLLYDTQSRLLGQVVGGERGDGAGVRLQQSAQGPGPRDVGSKIVPGSASQLIQEGEVVMETSSALAGPWAMMPYMIQAEIPELERAALGIWLERQQHTL